MNEKNEFNSIFYEESFHLISEIESVVLDLEANPNDKGLIDSLFRSVHTLKGNSGMFGFQVIADLGHLLENIIGGIRDEGIAINSRITELLLSFTDLVGNIFKKEDIAQADIDSLKSELENFEFEKTTTEVLEKKYHIFFKPMSDIFKLGLDPYLNLEELKDMGEFEVLFNIDHVPNFYDIDPEKCYLSFDINITTTSTKDDIMDVFLFVEDESEIKIEEVDLPDKSVPDEDLPEKELPDRDLSEKDISLDLPDKNTGDTFEKVKSYLGKEDSNIIIATKKLDNMVNLVGELVMNQSRLAFEIGLRDKDPLKNMILEMGESVQELRAAVLELRMTPIGTKFASFRRLVRDLSLSLGKKVELFTHGEDTELDKSIIEKVWEPFVHLIRNSIDHGIEPPKERINAGKNETGKIVISAKTKESGVEISISDDGKGLDEARIYESALNKKFIKKDMIYSKEDIFDFIFLPGFSTSEKISDVSGRGVGMDAVKKKIENLNGEIKIQSVKGKGTTILIYLPLTLAIIDVLMLETGGMSFAVPLSHIEECFDFNRYHIKSERNRPLIKFRGRYIPYFRLSSIFGLERKAILDEEQVIVVEHGDSLTGVVVDSLLKSQQVVIKSMSRWYKRNDGISGAAVLHDGSLAYILDIVQIVKKAFEAHSL